MRTLHVLVDNPCFDPDVRFEERDGVRHCLACDAPQFDLRRATLREARALFRAHGGRLCGQFVVDARGAAVFRPDPPSGAAPLVRGAALAISLAACGGTEAETPSSAPLTTAPSASEPAAPVAQSVASPPAPTPSLPTTATPQAVALASAIDHATDASADPTHHEGHAHEHAPVVVGRPHPDDVDGLVGVGSPPESSFLASGGARAVYSEEELPGHVTVGDLTTTDELGGLDLARVRQRVASRALLLRGVYARSSVGGSSHEGEIDARFTVDTRGAVTTAEVTRDALGVPEVTTYVRRMLRTLRFAPAPEDGAVTFTVTLRFDHAA